MRLADRPINPKHGSSRENCQGFLNVASVPICIFWCDFGNRMDRFGDVLDAESHAAGREPA